MIRTVRIEINAAYPQMPLERAAVYSGSAASFTIINVPRKHGNRDITGVSVGVTSVAGVTQSFSAVRDGCAWNVTVPASAIGAAGNVRSGVVIAANGTDENEGEVPCWILGVGDLAVLPLDGTVTPGETATNLRGFDETPSAPAKWNVRKSASGFEVYYGGAWVALGGGGSVTLDDTVTQSSANGVKSSGIWTFVKGLIGNLTGTVAEALDGKADKNATYTQEEIRSLLDSKADLSLPFAVEGATTVPDALEALDALKAEKAEIPELVAPSVSATNAQAAQAKATGEALAAKLDADDPVLTATAPSVDADETALAGAKATGEALATIDNTLGEAYNMASGASNWVATVGQYRVAHLDDDGLADDTFATDLLSKQVAINALHYALYSVPTTGADANKLKDRAVNAFTFSGGSLPTFPAQVAGYARDFLLNVTATADGSNITIPEPDGSTATSIGDALAFTAGKTYLVAITEIAAKHYYIRVIDTTPANAA